jgi:uncharacterized protein YdeI (BOF family)
MVPFLEVLQTIIPKYNIDSLLFLIHWFKQWTPQQIIEQMEIDEEMMVLTGSVDNDYKKHMADEVNQLYKFLNKKEEIQRFVETHQVSKKFFEYGIMLILIAKNFIIQKIYREATYSVNYDLSAINNDKIFASKKIYYVFFFKTSNGKNPKTIKVTNKVHQIKNVHGFIGQLSKQKNPTIIKNYFEYGFLNPGQWISSVKTIGKKKYYMVVVCKGKIEEKINNTIFNFLEINFQTELGADQVEKLLNPLNSTGSKEILLTLNKIFQSKSFSHLKFKTYTNQTIESIGNHADLLDIVTNFGPKKYLLIPQSSGYVVYVVLGVHQENKKSLNIKPVKYIMEYVLKNF